MIRLRSVAQSDTGYLRATNQDLALVSPDLAAIADGMGGHLGGEVAARVAVEELFAAFRQDRTTVGLVEAVRAANDAVWRRSRSDRNLRGMGTTLTAAALVAPGPVEAPAAAPGTVKVALVNVGDSRGYLFDPVARELHQLTEDHSVVEEMVRSGELTEDEAAVHPHRHILTRAVGIEPGIDPDLWELDLAPGARLLLCSDGLSNELDIDELARVLRDQPDTGEAAEELMHVALQRGGSDNITVVVIDVVELPDGTAEPPDEVVVVPATALAGADDGSGRRGITEAVPVTPPAAGAVLAAGVFGPGSDRYGVPPVDAELADERAGAARSGAPHGPRGGPVLLVPPAKRPKGARDRIVTMRVIVFLVLFVAVFGTAVGVVFWYNDKSFYVGMDQGHVAIFQGRPGGILWIKPNVVEKSQLTQADVLQTNLPYLEQGISEPSYSSARGLVDRLTYEMTEMVASGTTTTTSTTTTVPKSTTTTYPYYPTTTTAPRTTTTTQQKGGSTTTTTGASTTTTTQPRGGSTTTTTAPSTTTTTQAKGK